MEERTSEALGLLYAMHWPFHQPETGRGIRKSVLHDRLEKAGACFGEMSGWERANWFAVTGTNQTTNIVTADKTGLSFPSEHNAARENVALFDMSSFGKFLLGKDTEKILNRINDVAVPVGKQFIHMA